MARERMLVGTHPIAYLARGSHAFYFRPKWRGHPTTFPWRIPSWLTDWLDAKADLQLAVAESNPLANDEVPYFTDDQVRTGPAANTVKYSIEVMPPVTHVQPTDPSWDDWWWLRYGGYWSPGNKIPILSWFYNRPSVHGPAFQGDRWSRLWKWADETCKIDAVANLTTLPHRKPRK